MQPHNSSSIRSNSTRTPSTLKKPAAAADEGPRRVLSRPEDRLLSSNCQRKKPPRVSESQIKRQISRRHGFGEEAEQATVTDTLSLSKKKTKKRCWSMCHYATASKPAPEAIRPHHARHEEWTTGSQPGLPPRVSLRTAFSKSFRQRSLRAQAVHKLLHEHFWVFVCYGDERTVLNL